VIDYRGRRCLRKGDGRIRHAGRIALREDRLNRPCACSPGLPSEGPPAEPEDAVNAPVDEQAEFCGRTKRKARSQG
jgi:hypothetical protein